MRALTSLQLALLLRSDALRSLVRARLRKKLRLYCAFGARRGRPSWISRRLGCSWDRFGSRNDCISACLGCARAFGAYFVQEQQNLAKTVSERTSELARDNTKTTKICLQSIRAFGRADQRVRTGLGDGSERRWDRSGLPTCRPKRPTWQPRRPTWRARWSNLRPKAVPSASWSDLTSI